MILSICLVLMAGLASGFTSEQQIMLDGMNLSYELGMAYEKALQGQNVAEYNALVDEYIVFNITYLTYHTETWESTFELKKDLPSYQRSYL